MAQVGKSEKKKEKSFFEFDPVFFFLTKHPGVLIQVKKKTRFCNKNTRMAKENFNEAKRQWVETPRIRAR